MPSKKPKQTEQYFGADYIIPFHPSPLIISKTQLKAMIKDEKKVGGWDLKALRKIVNGN